MILVQLGSPDGVSAEEVAMSNRNIVKYSLPILLLAASMCATALPAQLASEAASVSRPLPYILVSGEAESTVAPDKATLGLGVVVQAAKAQDAQSAAGRAATALISAIRNLGVAKQDIQTSALDLTPLRSAAAPGNGYNQDRPITGYRAGISLTVTIKNIQSVGRVLDSAVAAGANQVSYLSFGLTDDRPAKREALAAAARDAREKAAALARALNFRLGPVLEVTESGSLIQPHFTTTFRRAMSPAVAAESTPIESGKVKISSRVTMKVEIASQLKSTAVPAGDGSN